MAKSDCFAAVGHRNSYDRVALELRHIAQEKSAEMLIPDLLYLQSYNT